MKITPLFFILFAAVVAFTAVGCTTSQMAADNNYPEDRQIGNRIYINDPYAGTIVLERDPYTGRYYDVTYGAGSGYYGYSPYNSRYSNSYYYRNRYPRTRVTPQQPTQEEQQQYQQNREEARKKILGKN